MPEWLDIFLISPFRWPASAMAGLLLGSAFLAAYAVLIGEITSALLFLVNKRYYASLQRNMVDAHNTSVEALHSGDKESYLAINKMAHEHFGKFFFAQAALGTSSLWPAPFALWWMSMRFEGIPLVDAPWGLHIGYVFVFISFYITERILFSRLKLRMPFFSRIVAIQRETKEACGKLKSIFSKQ